MKKLYSVLAFVVIVSMLLVSCQTVVPVEETEVPVVVTEAPVVEKTNLELQDGKPFRFISCNRQHPVVQTMAMGFFDACKDLGVECIDNSFDGVDLTQMDVMADIAISQGSSGAIPFVDAAVYAADQKIVDAGIPSIAIHTPVVEGTIPGLLGWVAADSVDYAIRSANFLGEAMGGKGVVAVTQFSLNDLENVVVEEFTKEMNAKFPEIVVLPPEMEGGDQPQAIAVATTILQAHPEVTAAFGTTGNSPVTWAKAAQAIGKAPGEILIIGMDYTRQNLDLVKSGEVLALVGQPLYEELYRAVELLVANLHGEPVEYANIYPAPIITIDDVDKYYEYADRIVEE